MAAAQHCANEAHATDKQEPMGREAIPPQEPLLDYNSPEGEVCQDRMFRYLLADTKVCSEATAGDLATSKRGGLKRVSARSQSRILTERKERVTTLEAPLLKVVGDVPDERVPGQHPQWMPFGRLGKDPEHCVIETAPVDVVWLTGCVKTNGSNGSNGSNGFSVSNGHCHRLGSIPALKNVAHVVRKRGRFCPIGLNSHPQYSTMIPKKSVKCSLFDNKEFKLMKES
ncbi:Lysine-Specific Demethylase 5B [Manis pentadactyla]|nr:Lysine-Specific Demethylase 5B [Manis pentadactyla]